MYRSRCDMGVSGLAGLVLVVCLGAYGGIAASSGNVAAAQDAPRVFFVTPADGSQHAGDDVIEIEFGAENYPISAIPEGFDPETDTPRAGMGHYHLGYDTGCLPVGEIIPEGQGWQHFGDGSNTTMLENAPARTYSLTVQIGDDEHRTQEGLCTTISIEVTGGGQ